MDKFEEAYDVINVDIKDFKSDKKYDFIYSISTFEHMDSDGGKNPDYAPKEKNSIFSSYAFEYMNSVINNLLLKGGKLIITFPLGYENCEIDKSVYKKEYVKFNAKNVDTYLFKRINETTWKQINLHERRFAKEKHWPVGRDYLCVMEITK